jgi:hypothetical protein
MVLDLDSKSGTGLKKALIWNLDPKHCGEAKKL